MLIGFMRNFESPRSAAKLTAMLCKYHNIDLIYLRPGDIDITNQQAEGKMYINGKWKRVKTDIPRVIDISPYCFRKKHKKTLEFLRTHTYLTYDENKYIDKEILQEELLKDEEFSQLVIPTRRIESFENMEEFLNKYQAIVIKPVRGEKGKGVHIVRKDGEVYRLGYQRQEQILSQMELQEYYRENLENKEYIVQKYIASRTKNGDPFDCRIHVQKNRHGKWEVGKNFIRIGIGQQVMSNVNQGGGISDLEPFLKANFDERWKEISDRINQLAQTLPYKIEAIKQAPIMIIGFDVAIDQNGDLYVIESNQGPSTAALQAKSALMRTEYYIYLFENILGRQKVTSARKKSIEKLEKENKDLQQRLERSLAEKDCFRNKYVAITNSKSWRMTAPVRMAGLILKKMKKS